MKIELTREAIKVFVANCKCKENLLGELVGGIFTNNDRYNNINVSSEKLFEVLNYSPTDYAAARTKFHKQLCDYEYRFIKDFLIKKDYYFKDSEPSKVNPIITDMLEYNFIANYALVKVKYNPGRFHNTEECTDSGVRYKDAEHPYYHVHTEEVIEETMVIQFS